MDVLIVKLLCGAIIACVTAITHLYYRQTARDAKLLEEVKKEMTSMKSLLHDCEKEKESLNIRVAVLETGCGNIDCGMRLNTQL